jgi:hypothetical protein
MAMIFALLKSSFLIERSYYENERAYFYEADLWAGIYPAMAMPGPGERMVTCLVG